MTEQKVTSVRHWSDKTFSFSIERPAGFRFRSGEFVMIGMHTSRGPIMRAYSIASSKYDDYLEFLSIKVPNGALTAELQHVRVGDSVILGSKPVGTLVIDNLITGGNLYLFATGTGLAPFMSIIRDIDTYESFSKVVLIHTVRTFDELAYFDEITSICNDPNHPLAELSNHNLIYYPTLTREFYQHIPSGRCSTLFKSGQITEDLLALPSELAIGYPFDITKDGVMLCGSKEMNLEFINYLKSIGASGGTGSIRGTYVYEKAFV